MMTILKMSVLFFVGSLSFTSFAQHSLSKKEIFDSWVKSSDSKDSYDKSIGNLSHDSELNSRIQISIEDLRKKGVDTLLVLINSYPGLYTRDSCNSSTYPSDAYIFWKLGEKENLRKIPNKCGVNGAEMQCSFIFEFYDQYKDLIRQDFIMPVILSAKMQNERISYTREVANHENLYTFFYYINGDYKTIKFSKGDIFNKKSIFYNDNRNTKVYKWFLLSEKVIEKKL